MKKFVKLVKPQKTYKKLLESKKINFPENWESLYAAWDNGEITAKEFMDTSGLKKGTFYNLVNDYREIIELNEKSRSIC